MKLSLSFCQKHKIVLEATSDQASRLFYVNEPEFTTLAEVQRRVANDYQLEQIPEPLFEEKIRRLYHDSSDVAELALKDIGEESLEKIAESLNDTQDLLTGSDDAPITQLINILIAQAAREQASDIHIEVYEYRLRIRFRIDGVLREILQPNYALASRIIARIKVMAKLDIAEKRLPQDGRISTKLGNRHIDIRVSTLPSSHAEKVVLRLLEKEIDRLDLQNLGMPDDIYQIFNRLIHRSQGIVLVTGPTGSGKTTTLYAALTKLNNYEKNIVTVEDPIEYYLDGINQTAVNTKVEMTFARGLRAILRQDPDIIMVGEIRDIETAQIAIQASLTGHLVFSTLHTNTAIGAISRMRDMGVEPFLLASSLSGILAQRLLRLLCPHCKEPYYVTDEEYQTYFTDYSRDKLQIFTEKGCEKCGFSGYLGRLGIYELIEIDHTLKDMIHNQQSEGDLANYLSQYSQTIQQNAIELISKGQTTLNEVFRVTA